jgi:hypothetical protein
MRTSGEPRLYLIRSHLQASRNIVLALFRWACAPAVGMPDEPDLTWFANFHYQ